MENKLLEKREVTPLISEISDAPLHIQFYDQIENSWKEAMDFHVKKMDISFERLVKRL